MSFATLLIELQYQNSMQCARDLENCANVIRGVSTSDVSGIVSALGASWEGEAANLCIRKTTGLQGDIKKDADDLARTAQVIRTIADNVRRAELTAYNLAHKRRY